MNAESLMRRAGKRRWAGKEIGATMVVGILCPLRIILVAAVEQARNAARLLDGNRVAARDKGPMPVFTRG
jgi:hypothetical protein